MLTIPCGGSPTILVFILLPRLSLDQTCSEERRYLFVKSTDPWSRVIKLFHTQSCLRASIITPHILLGLFTTKHSQFIMLTHYNTYLTLRFRVGINVGLSHPSIHGLKWVSAHRNMPFLKLCGYLVYPTFLSMLWMRKCHNL